jgi:general secretion pathway protein E
MSQRLIRRLDETTKQPYEPDEKSLQLIQRVIATLPEGVPQPDLTGIKLFRPGSSATNPYGYSGQIAIREQFTMSGEMRTIMERGGKDLSAQSIEETAIKSGMTTMLQDGILQVCKGVTSLEEVYRVVG